MSKKKVVPPVALIQGKVDAAAYITANGYPEVGAFLDQKSLQKFYKQLETPTLEDWAKIEGLEYKTCTDSEPIHRMRVCMAILYKHYPKEGSAKKDSPYKKYSLEDLVNLAIEHSVAIEDTDDERILRMRLIMALRANKVIE
jgi:hypothetical protein